MKTEDTGTFLRLDELKAIINIQEEFNNINELLESKNLPDLEKMADEAVRKANDSLVDIAVTEFRWKLMSKDYKHTSPDKTAEFHWFLIDTESEDDRSIACPYYDLGEDWIDFPGL